MESDVGYSNTSTSTIPWAIKRRIILEENVDSLNSVISRKVSFEISKPNEWFVNSMCENSVSIIPNHTESFNQEIVHSNSFVNNINHSIEWKDEPMEVDRSDTEMKTGSDKSGIVSTSDSAVKDKASNSTFGSEVCKKEELDGTEVRLRKTLMLNVEKQNKLSREDVFVTKNSSKSYKYLCIAIFLVIFVSALLFFTNDVSKDTNLQFENLRSEFKERVFSQQKAVSAVEKTLENMNNWQSKLKTLAFVGGMGVGKTFVANILKQHFPENLVHDVNFTQLKSKTLEKKLNSCCCNLIIVDNLKVSDLYNLMKFIQTLPKDQLLLVVAIFSTQETDANLVPKINYDDVSKVQKAFHESDLYYEVLFYLM